MTYAALPGHFVRTGNPDQDDFMERLAELEKQYPSRTPLDDDEPGDGGALDDDRD